MITLDALRRIDFLAAAGCALFAVLLLAFPASAFLAALAAALGVTPKALFVMAGVALARWYHEQGGKTPIGPAGLADVLEPKQGRA